MSGVVLDALRFRQRAHRDIGHADHLFSLSIQYIDGGPEHPRRQITQQNDQRGLVVESAIQRGRQLHS